MSEFKLTVIGTVEASLQVEADTFETVKAVATQLIRASRSRQPAAQSMARATEPANWFRWHSRTTTANGAGWWLSSCSIAQRPTLK